MFCLLVLFGLGTTAVFSGDATPSAYSYLPVVMVPDGTPTVTPTPTNTPLPTVVPPSSVPNVRITQIEYDPASGTDLEGEFVRIVNNEAGPVDLTGWHLSDEADTVFTFPAYILGPGTVVKVWVREGTNSSNELFWGRNRSVWNNGGDTAFLKNASNVLVDSCSYSGGSVSTGCN